MKRILLILALLPALFGAWAQDTDTLRGIYRCYPVPESIADTPAPKAYQPVYISHYGRHGSRCHLARMMVKAPLDSLEAARERGSITPLGIEVLSHLKELYAQSEGHWGDLTAPGACEHRGIAARMASRFAPVFRGRRRIEAVSSLRDRCKASMAGATMALQEAAPGLRISRTSDKSTHALLKNEDVLKEAQLWYGPRLDSLTLAARDWKPCIAKLYTDCRGDGMAQMILARWLWNCWAEAPCTGLEGFDILSWMSFEELQDMARWTDMNICMKCLRSDRFLESRIASQAALLDDIVLRADEALSGGKTAADLRFGHDANLVPLMGLMNAEGFEGVYVLKDRPDPRWNSARMVPMASNMQLVFYRSPRSRTILVKLLYNERETLIAGLDPVQGPYYDWDALKRFWKIQQRCWKPGGPSEMKLDVRSLGAVPDGRTKLTSILQEAIDRVSAAGGGKVVLEGGTFLTGPLELKSGVNLHIAEGAVLKGSPDLSDYPDRPQTRHFDTRALPRQRNIALIYADEAEDVAITGRGIIDCSGDGFVKAKTGDGWTGWHFERTVPREKSIPRAVFFAGCRNVTVRDITMVNQPAGWSYWVHDCDFVRFRDCRILADVRYPNNDGIHVNCSRDVFISGCEIETGDDSIILRANSRSLRENRPCERVVATDCRLRSWSSAVRIGWDNDGVVRGCSLTNLRIWDSSNGIGCYVPLMKHILNSNDYGREATLIEDLWCDDVTMDGIIGNPVYFKIASDGSVDFAGIRDVRLHNVRSRALEDIYIGGRAGTVTDVTFDGCSFEKCGPGSLPGDPKRHGYVLAARWPALPEYSVCAYVWPSCHDDSLAHAWLWPEGEGEWEVIRKGNPRFEGHLQPKEPLWGYEHDDDPAVVEKWINTALEHGVNTFIYDWYWYNAPGGYSGPYLEGALDRGFLGAPSNPKMNFYLMYANHDVKYNYWNYHKWGDRTDLLFNPRVGMDAWKKIVRRVITQYFHLPNYVKIDGCPVFAMFNADIFRQGFSSDEEAAGAMEYFREEVRRAGFPGLHIQLTPGGGSDPSPAKAEKTRANIELLGINSIAFYNMGGFNCDYVTHCENAVRMRRNTDAAYDIPLFPTVSIGWDDTPRFPAKGAKDVTRWNNTPEVFGRYLRIARDYADSHSAVQPRFVMINAWNEWVEGSYLLPDTKNGFSYLETVKEIFR